jgi:hypothetical protein
MCQAASQLPRESLIQQRFFQVIQRGFVAPADLAAFLNAGYTKAQVIEVLLGVGMKTFNNYVDHIARVPLNDQFKAEAWQPKRKVA